MESRRTTAAGHVGPLDHVAQPKSFNRPQRVDQFRLVVEPRNGIAQRASQPSDQRIIRHEGDSPAAQLKVCFAAVHRFADWRGVILDFDRFWRAGEFGFAALRVEPLQLVTRNGQLAVQIVTHARLSIE